MVFRNIYRYLYFAGRLISGRIVTEQMVRRLQYLCQMEGLPGIDHSGLILACRFLEGLGRTTTRGLLRTTRQSSTYYSTTSGQFCMVQCTMAARTRAQSSKVRNKPNRWPVRGMWGRIIRWETHDDVRTFCLISSCLTAT